VNFFFWNVGQTFLEVFNIFIINVPIETRMA